MIEKFFPHESWSTIILENSLGAYTDAVLISVIFIGIFYVVNNFVMRQFERIADRTATELDDIFVKIIMSMRPPFYLFLAFYIGFNTLNLHHLVERSIFVIVVVWCAWQVMHAFDLLIDHIARRQIGSAPESSNISSAIELISTIAKVGLWILVILMILSNFGINTTSLIAGFGIGGIAIAFAVKGILEDLFSSFSIYFDKPFHVGDTIGVDGEKGKVEKIGIKTTRLKSMVTGEEIIMTNKELTTKKINNYQRLTKRRTSFDVGVTYETPTKKLEKIPKIIQKIIEKEDLTEFNRAHFRSFDDSSLRFSVLYHFKSRDYDSYLVVHERILFGIRKAFEKENIEMAYPTQTLYIKK